MLLTDKMVVRTKGKNCVSKRDYFAWEDMRWNVTGVVGKTTVDEADVCADISAPKVYLTAPFNLQIDCMRMSP